MGRELIILTIAFFLVFSATFHDDRDYISSGHPEVTADYVEIVRAGVGRVYPLSTVEDYGIIADRQAIKSGDSIEYLDDGTAELGRMSGGGLLLFGMQIDLNSSGAYDISAIPGIGSKTAESIVKFRKESGRFQSVDGLRAVRGIGEKRLEKIRSYLTI